MSSRFATVEISPARDDAYSPTRRELLDNVDNMPDEETSFRPPLFPFMLSFRNLTYSVKVGRNWKNLFIPVPKEKILLNDISGDVKEREILAVLGPSGSGKSTLLDALANRISKGSLKGLVTLINGEKLDSSLLKAKSAYVMQDDELYTMLTVEETLMFTAKLRLPNKFSDKNKKKRVHALIEQLGLKTAAKTVIGDDGRRHRGVSGGERRRVSIGIGIINDPMILFVDEPTSGLDSTSAYMVVNVLKRIAQGGSIVIMSIHQPSYRIVSLLDRLLMLSRGQTVYNGSPSNLPLFMANFGLPVPEEANPVEFALDTVCELEALPKGSAALVEFNKSSFTIPENPSRDFSLTEALHASISRGVRNSDKCATMIPSFANPFWTEVGILVKRSYLNSLRMPAISGVRYGVLALNAFLLATLYWHVDHSTNGIHERASFFVFAFVTVYYTCADALPVFLEERLIFMREADVHTYRRSSYAIANALAAVPSLMLQSLLLACTTFWALRLEGGISGFSFYYIIILASFWSGTSFVTMVSGVMPQLRLSYIGVVATLGYFFVASGFYIARSRIPSYWIWIHYLSLPKYSYEALMQNEFQDPGKCYMKGFEIFDDTFLSGFPMETKMKLLLTLSGQLGIIIKGETCVTSAADVLKDLGITQLISKWNYLWVILSWGILFRIVFYMSLLVGSRNYRK